MPNIAITNLFWDEDLSGGAWAITCYQPNTPTYEFASYFDAQDFANAMRSGSKDELYEVMGRCFVNTQQPVNRIFDNLFTDSNTLMFEGETIFEVQEVTDTLDEFLVEAGQDLVEALLAGVQKAPPDVRMSSKFLGKGRDKNMITVRLARQQQLSRTRALEFPDNIVSNVAPDFSMIWTNYTNDIDFTVAWSCDVLAGNLIQNPTPDPDGTTHLRSHTEQTLSWYQGFSSLVQEQVDGYIIITDPSGTQIGVEIHVPVQVVGIGTAPYYLVGQEPPGTAMDWTGNYTSQGYQFQNLPSGIGQIIVTPTASHSSLTMTVDINPPAASHPKQRAKL